MLNIFNELKPFFEDCYREISVREYSREAKISPPTASKILRRFESEGLLISNEKGIYIYFRANREGFLFKQMARLYWHLRLHDLTGDLHEGASFGKIILFGSLSKAENTKDSDADLFLESEEKKIDVSKIERALRRKVQLHFIKSMKNNNLWKNIEQGVMIR